MHQLVAAVGLSGAGKSELVSIFTKLGYSRVYFGDLTLRTIKERGLQPGEASEKIVREGLRREHGMDVYAKLNVGEIKRALSQGDTVIDGLYSWEEYVFLKKHFPQLRVVAVYSPPQLRAKRLANRPVRPLTAEQLQARDYSQIENLNQSGPIAMADHTFCNTEDMSLKKYHQQVHQYAKSLETASAPQEVHG